MKQEILTLEHGVLADALVSLKESSRKISRFMQEYRPLLDGDRYLTDKEVAGLLKVSRRTLQKMRNDRTLPFMLIGGKALYREHDIQTLLERNYRKAEE
ncbi:MULTISPECIES: helix-turn-helix domain-containing protein [Bacteroidaceae]|mgnify:CR=1 FL=1|jgi:excisionase family DNA binding protein|uniref:DNA-binding protein n=2 Tax=Bacteroides TaxID=816 RepID=A0A3E4MZS4_9BACE|nr:MULTISPECIES: helix-turn-helix domain-containing protein [Bacteroidaceae]MBX9091787.1 helix-turn-helix domain-containing protein [Bacteroides xylanisolvens]MBX9168612.1 helix-turn-helix domain-containing protein [Bacteroides xylanisolvens]MCG0351555.1 helix-turn-helix domain-containing protein [Phocaeicola vulgatus]RGK54856.1 DNA-binding protein [Bacteroides xylanisolvens]RHH27575.1 DNA-binding protein [Bacteroides uniformis]